jgi:hypothetical protein
MNIVNNNGDILLQVSKRIGTEISTHNTKQLNMEVSPFISVAGLLQ